MSLQLEDLETDDMYLAAYFLLSGCELSNRRWVKSRVIFIFKNPGGSMSELREAFYSGKAHVRPHDFVQKIIAIKQLLSP